MSGTTACAALGRESRSDTRVVAQEATGERREAGSTANSVRNLTGDRVPARLDDANHLGGPPPRNDTGDEGISVIHFDELLICIHRECEPPTSPPLGGNVNLLPHSHGPPRLASLKCQQKE